jgi:hypothetical protein
MATENGTGGTVMPKYIEGQLDASLEDAQRDIPGAELRRFFSDHARKIADEAEHRLPIEPREIELLVQAARAIIHLEKAA